MISNFIELTLAKARYKIIADGSYFGEITGLKGVWTNAKNLEDCRRELNEVLEEWLILKIQNQEPIPGFNIKQNKRLSMKTDNAKKYILA